MMNFIKSTKQSIYSLMILSILTVAIAGCGDDDNESPSIMSADQAGSKALQVVSGEVLTTELDTTGTVNEWDVTVVTDAGSEVELEFDQVTGEIREIDGDQAPFTYEINPGMGLILFSQAKEIAFNQIQLGEIRNWELEKDSLGVWIYEFVFVSDGPEEIIKVDAATGKIVE